MDLSAIFTPDPSVVRGGRALGDMLVGDADQRVYTDQLKRNFEAQDAFAKARQQRAQMLARDGITPEAAIAAGIPANQAPFVVSLVGAADTPNLRNGGLDELGDLAIDAEREKAMTAGNFQRANQLTALKTDKNYEPVRIAQGNAMPSGVGLGDELFEMVPLPQTLATIEQREKVGDAALVRANAAANASNAMADKHHRTDPNLGRAAKKPGKKADAPKKGDVVDGYRFKGGEPGDKANWEKV